MLWALQVALEGELCLAACCLDAVNGFNELERDAMRASIVAHTHMHKLLPLFDMLYTDKEGELWLYDDQGVLHGTFHL